MSPSLDSLPEEVREVIFAKLADDQLSIREILNLHTVSKTWRRLCNGDFVLSHVSFRNYPFPSCFSTDEYRKKLTKFLQKCYDAGNPDAEYRAGVVQYYEEGNEEQEQQAGLQLMSKAAAKGLKEAQYNYGLILVCLGGGNKSKGYELLSPIRVQLSHFMTLHDDDGFEDAAWLTRHFQLKEIGQPMVKLLKRSYTRGSCSCEGVKEGLLQKPVDVGALYNRYQRFRIRLPALTCDICFCHHVLQLFFDVMEK